MVEGPGCTLNGIKLRRCVGQRVHAVRGLEVNSNNASDSTAGNAAPKAPASRALGPDSWSLLVGFFICAVRTLGKELFVFFSRSDTMLDYDASKDSLAEPAEYCLRVHFGMSGKCAQL